MMKTLDFRLASSAAQGKAVTTIPVRPRLPVAARPCIKRLYGNRSVSRTGVKTHAAESGAVAPRSEPIPLTALKAGDEFEGRVVKVEKFGAFVNFGAAKDGLVHISQLSDKYVQDATKAVKPQDSVKVRVMSADPATGRIALSMKGMEATPNETAPMATMETMEEENEEGGDEEVQMELPVEAEEGHQIVDADEEPDVLYQMLEEDPEITLESVAAFEAMDFKDVNLNVDVSESMPAGAIGDAISGTVSRVEDYGVFVEFGKGGRTYTGLLPTDEAKVPAAALSPEKLAQYVPAGSPVPTYVSESIDMDDKISNFYKIGDTVQALILEYTDQNKIALTQWADWEVDEDAAQLGEGFIEDEADPVSLDPLEMIGEEESGDDEDADAEAMKRDDEMVLDEKTGLRKGDVKESYALMGRHGRIMSPSMMENFMTFSSRPLNKIDVGSLNARHIEFTTRDMENDEVTLNDYWQPIETTSHSKRVAAFVKDLMSADEDEDEVPARAYRAPLVKAAAAENISAAAVKDLRGQTGAGMMDCKKALAECGGDAEQAKDWLRKKGLSGADKKMGRTAAEGAIASYIHPGSRLGVLMEVNCETDFVAASDNFLRLVGEIGMILASCPDVAVVNPEDVPADLLAREREVEMGKEELKSKPEGVRGKIVEGRIQKIKDNWALVNQDSLRAPGKKMSEVIKETISQVGENIQVRRFERFNLGEGIEKKQSNLAEEVAQQMAAGEAAAKQEEKKPEPAPAPSAAEEAVPQVEVSAKAVKELRMKMGAGMMDCKKALAVNNNDMDAAVNWLRKKGLASADKKAGRVAAEGVIASYIHPGSRLGVLMEVNCETDFVAASDKFVQLVQTLGMQIAQSNATYVSPEDIPAEVFVREKELEMQREDIKSKPEAIRAKIAEGRAAKIGQEMALYPQPFLADNSKTVEEAIKEATAAIGEKISLRRFVKYSLGEGIEKKQSNLAEEVASFAQKASQ